MDTSPLDPSPRSPSDVADIEAVVRDYIEGWYTGNAQRMDFSLHADLVKRTPVKDGLGQPGQLRGVTRTQMLELTMRRGGEGSDGDVEISIDDVCNDIAAARVLSRDYLDFLHLVRTTEGWKIANVLFHTLA